MAERKLGEERSADQEEAERQTGAAGGGQSGGGGYAVTGKRPHKKTDGFLGHGGQSEMEYHGTGQLGEEEVGDNANSPARDGASARPD